MKEQTVLCSGDRQPISKAMLYILFSLLSKAPIATMSSPAWISAIATLLMAIITFIMISGRFRIPGVSSLLARHGIVPVAQAMKDEKLQALEERVVSLEERVVVLERTVHKQDNSRATDDEIDELLVLYM